MADPVITSITPASGPTAGGTTVTIVGTGFDTATDVDFGATPAADFSALSATLIVAISPAGSAGEVDVTVTNTDGESDPVSFGYGDGLFTVGDARSYVDAGLTPLSDATAYPAAAIIACEAHVRELFESACGVAFLPTTSTEVLDGTTARAITVSRANPCHEVPARAITVTAASIDGVALTAGELAALKCHPDGTIARVDGGTWSSGTGYQDMAVSITYVHGWATVPAQVKEAALMLAVRMLVGSDVPMNATSYSDGNATFSLTYAGQAPHWTGIAWVDAVLMRYWENPVGIA